MQNIQNICKPLQKRDAKIFQDLTELSMQSQAYIYRYHSARLKQVAFPGKTVYKALNFQNKELNGHIQWKKLLMCQTEKR